MTATTQPRGSQATAASPPPWEVLQLVSQSMDDDPKSVAVACCVSKSWHAVFTADRLWTRLCRSLFPSSAHSAAAAAISPHHLFRLLHTATTRRRRVPSPLRLSLSCLLFFLDIFQSGAPVLSLARAGTELVAHHGIFRFSVPIGGEEAVVLLDAREESKVAWHVATADWREAFALMEFEGQGKSVGNRETWFSEKLPCSSACCCSEAEASGIEAQVFIELSDEVPGGGNGGDGVAGVGSPYRRVEKVSFGLMNTKTWRYTNLEDGLLHLQHFLFEC